MSNSFLTSAEGDNLASERLDGSTWTDATEPQQTAALITATRLLSRVCYIGIATSSTQSLPFPRMGLLASGGWPLDSSIIPLDLKLATFELALALLRSPTLYQESETSTQGISRIKAGPIEIGFRDNVSYKLLPSEVQSFLVSSWLCETQEEAKVIFRSI